MPAIDRPALPVDDLDAARRFYVHALGCRLVETTDMRLTLELHEQTLMLVSRSDEVTGEATGEISFVLRVDDWCALSERLREHDIEVDIEPGRRFSVEPGTQCAMRLSDPDGNEIALRGFAPEPGQLAA